MRTSHSSSLSCLALTALAAQGAHADDLRAPASVAAPPATAAVRARTGSAQPWHFGFTPLSLRELMNLYLPRSPASLLPDGWEPAVTSSRTEALHQTTIDLGLRRQFAGRSSAQLGARITVLDCISIDNSGRFALGDSGSKVHGLIGFTYRY
ncbi:MAG: hypothetical protein IT480_17340 [Gammaproteobacteria bacterium]|nr:hypothetical protein [Gammaproteobacteria bacterium]